MIRKGVHILGEVLKLIRVRRLYILAPLLLALVLISFLVYYVGPSVVITFIYAGV